MRPSFACKRRLSRFTKGTHFTQYDEPLVTAAPQIGQRGVVLGIAAAFTTKLPAFALLRLACVSLVTTRASRQHHAWNRSGWADHGPVKSRTLDVGVKKIRALEIRFPVL